MVLGRLVDIGFTVEVVTDEGAADVQHEAELLGQTEGVDETGVEGGAGGVAALAEAEDDTTTGIEVNLEETIRLVAAEHVHEVGVGQGEDIEVATLLERELLGIVLRIGVIVIGHLVGTEIGIDRAGLVGVERLRLIQALEGSPVGAEAHTEARGDPLGQVEVDGREDKHLGDFLRDLPVVVTVVHLGAETEAQLPVVPETVGEHGGVSSTTVMVFSSSLRVTLTS